MKTKILLGIFLALATTSKEQVLLNEVYSDPGAGKQEFFELYNTNPAPESMDNYTLVTFFDISGSTGFYVMDLPNLTVAQKGYFVGSAAIPFSYQGVINSYASDFSWNDVTTLAASNGYLKKWVKQSANLLDGNLYYDEVPVPANFNDLFYRRTGVGASYTVFLYKNGVLVNGVIFGSGGYASVIPVIISMPDFFVDMRGAAPDFTIKFSTYGSALIENVTQDAGSDNGFIRKADGQCGSWDKSSAQVQHTPQKTNGYVDNTTGIVSVSSIVLRGTALTGSKVNYDVLSAPAASFPITMDVYTDMGSIPFKVDATDPYVGSNTENVVTDGPFANVFFPFAANVLLVVKTNVGCIDKIILIPNAPLLPVKLISFTGNKNNGNISLQWSVASNEMLAKMDIEESIDGKNFENKSTIPASEKNGTENYNYSGASETNKAYYRLRITEKSGVVTYSKVLMFSDQTETKTTLNILGNTATDRLTISFQSQINQPADMNILDMNGRIVMKQKLQALKGNNVANISLPSSMNSGMYIAVLSADNTNSSAKFIKQ